MLPEFILSTSLRGGMPVRIRLRASGFYEKWLDDPKMPSICHRDPVDPDNTCRSVKPG